MGFSIFRISERRIVITSLALIVSIERPISGRVNYVNGQGRVTQPNATFETSDLKRPVSHEYPKERAPIELTPGKLWLLLAKRRPVSVPDPLQ